MGLSEPARIQRAAQKIGSRKVSRSLAYTRRYVKAHRRTLRISAPIIQQVLKRGLCIDTMQQQLKKTTLGMRNNPSSVLSLFQKTLQRPSYFFAPSGSAHWTVLFGPHPSVHLEFLDDVMAPSTVATTRAPSRVYDFVVAPPSWSVRVSTIAERILSFCHPLLRSLHQWLMHPLIDTR